MNSRLIFLDAEQNVRVNAYLVLALMFVLYLGGGWLYAWSVYDDIGRLSLLVAIAVFGLTAAGMVGRVLFEGSARVYKWERAQPRDPWKANRSEVILVLLAFLLLGLGCAFYLTVPQGYLGLDKVARSQPLREGYPLRIFLFVSPLALYMAISRGNAARSRCLEWIYWLYFILYGMISVIEINREMLMIWGVLILCWLGRYRGYLPRFLPSQLLLLMAAIALFFVLKGLLYPMFFGYSYDGGLWAFGEVVNWARWTMLTFENDINIAELHRYDFLYLLNAFVFPFSAVEGPSAIWFREVLGNEQIGATYGYSGLLSWYSVGGIFGAFAIPFGLGLLAMFLNRRSGPMAALASICFVLVAFRFVRSEYALVVKTYLWQFFYPGLFLLFLSKLRVARS
jgi:hypothetical protein